ncbi:MAG TPA: hypothetical protein VFU15_17080 [Bacteroidia bacterium]|nr:hypothetical protein [Bacteroidia bacterium]
MKKRWPFLFFPATFLLLWILALLSKGIYDPGDGVMHYLFAHYAGKHPALFLDHWAKPLYTLLSFPFAVFGYGGTLAFNLLCLCASGWFTWKIAEKLKLPFAPLAAPLVIFAPIALPVGMSGLTEPLFMLVLVAGIFFVMNGRNGIAALVISLLPFARTEGFFLAPLFAFYFLGRKDFVPVFLLGAGTLLYSVAGAFLYHDILWIIHKNPYTGAEKIYGHGTLFHFIALNEFTWGWGMTALLAMGMIAAVFRKRFAASVSSAEGWLVYGTFLLFLVMHSVFWWKGLFGSLGLHRVMACTIPSAVLISLRGFHVIGAYVRSAAAMKTIAGIVLAVQVFLTWRQHPLPLQPSDDFAIDRTAADFLAENNYTGERIFSSHPVFAFLAGKDPFDKTQFVSFTCSCLDTDFRKGDIVIWDSHFTKFDYGIPIEELSNHPKLKELARFGEMPATREEASGKNLVGIFQVK